MSSHDQPAAGTAGAPSVGVPLKCLRGVRCPAELGENLATLLALPPAVQETYAEVLQPNLAPVIDDRTETRVTRYCRRFDLEPAIIAPSIKACRFLFTNSVKAGVGRDAFIEDVKALVSDAQAPRVLSLLLPLFDAEVPQLMTAAALQSIAEHGKVVRAVRWRLDLIKASNHGLKLDVPVATITFQYQEGPNASHASFQLLPDQALELKRALAMIIVDDGEQARVGRGAETST